MGASESYERVRQYLYTVMCGLMSQQEKENFGHNTNPLLPNDFVADISIRATPKMGAPVKTHSNTSVVGFADGPISPRTAIHPTRFAPYDAKVGVLSANNTRCIGTIYQRHVHTRDVVQREL